MFIQNCRSAFVLLLSIAYVGCGLKNMASSWQIIMLPAATKQKTRGGNVGAAFLTCFC